jgi:hypothetical protein
MAMVTDGNELRRIELATIHDLEFHGGPLPVVRMAGEPYVVLRPVIEALGLDYSSQLKRLKRQPWGVVVMVTTTGADGKTYQMAAVSRKTFVMLLASVDVDRVSEATRDKLAVYQTESSEVLDAYWFDGGAINPRATSEQLDRVIDLCTKQAAVLRALDGIVAADWLEAKARHLAARALGEEPDVDPARRPLTVGEYLEDKGVRGAGQRRLARDFGKWLKAEYRSEYGCNPPMVPRFVDGAERSVCGYTDAHRPLFDAVWSTRCEAGDDASSVVESSVVRLPGANRGHRGRPA